MSGTGTWKKFLCWSSSAKNVLVTQNGNLRILPQSTQSLFVIAFKFCYHTFQNMFSGILWNCRVCQKRSFLHQSTHNMMTDCSLNYEFSTRKLQVQNMLSTSNCFLLLSWHSRQFDVHKMWWNCSFLVLNKQSVVMF